MEETIIIRIPSHPKYLSLARDVASRIGELDGIDETVIDNIKLAVDEACSNVIKHAYKGNTRKRIIIKYKITQKVFEVIIEDSGVKVQPALIKGRSLDDIRPGGLGVHLIKRAFDIFEYDEKKRRGNRLKLVKYLEEK
jgi:anti-sigma regulatory factor (Ser/Thr protein kinase)